MSKYLDEAQKISAFTDFDVSVTGDNIVTISDTGGVYLTNGRLARQFNFASQQVTTIVTSELTKGYSSGAGVTQTSSLSVQNFSDIDSWYEIKLAHQQLEAVGKKPLPLMKSAK